MATWRTPWASSQSDNSSNWAVMVPKVRTWELTVPSGPSRRTQATTVFLWTSNPAQQSRKISMVVPPKLRPVRADGATSQVEQFPLRAPPGCGGRQGGVRRDVEPRSGPSSFAGSRHQTQRRPHTQGRTPPRIISGSSIFMGWGAARAAWQFVRQVSHAPLRTVGPAGAWDPAAVTRRLPRAIEEAPVRTWHGYHVSAVDDTKVHRSGEHVWGTCTCHEYTARCPNRATTVRAHNWVVLGALLHEPDKPGWFLPISGRLYFRQSQLPLGPEGIVAFRTKCELAVELLREQARIIKGKHLGLIDGGYAL